VAVAAQEKEAIHPMDAVSRMPRVVTAVAARTASVIKTPSAV